VKKNMFTSQGWHGGSGGGKSLGIDKEVNGKHMYVKVRQGMKLESP
jgi:hypothetical protein